MYLRAMSALTVRVLVLCTALCVCGCSRSVEWLDRKDRSDVMVQRALARQNEGDMESAIRLYTEALESDPDLSRAHLEVALLLHDRRKDYVRAIYHYTRYLEKRSATEKRDMILNRIRLAKQAFAASLINAERYGMDRVLALESENEELKRTVITLEEDAGRAEKRLRAMEERLRAVETKASRHPPVSVATGTTETGPRVYKVKRGDTLSSIAAKLYGDAGKWRKIAEANKDELKGGDRVMVGQELVIP